MSITPEVQAMLDEIDTAVERSTEIMPLEQWKEYFLRLEGPEGCDFKYEGPGETNMTWRCAGRNDKTHSERILATMGLSKSKISEVLECVHSLGGHCDCEVLFNAAERIESQ